MSRFLAPIFLLMLAQAANAHAGHSHGDAPAPVEPAAEAAQAMPQDAETSAACDEAAEVQDASAQNATETGDQAEADGATTERESTVCR
ncbi:hypothetical protein [Paracoccus zhejiangensis]|uniref:Cobalt transporter n=1 Tax=Paracoccus zhejiangensis TaxID=1077935 RepID=A0A2H5EYR4_9RHOB|nr:hypothetical protein [Paracoccus zhejiangensis]AUH64413.1 hypothetical protein CX676_09775 [Paracoccus zhejiangensis]